MKAQIEISSISMSKNDPKISKLDKYDVEANIEEVDNSEEQSVFKYGFTALSNPKNVRLAIEGIAKIQGDTVEREEILAKDENDIPKILTMIYHELFPTFFLLSKNLNVSCPPHTIGAMGNAPIDEAEIEESSEVEEPAESETVESIVESSETEVPTESQETVEPAVESQESPSMAQPSV